VLKTILFNLQLAVGVGLASATLLNLAFPGVPVQVVTTFAIGLTLTLSAFAGIISK
jgi:hypothetical protein